VYVSSFLNVVRQVKVGVVEEIVIGRGLLSDRSRRKDEHDKDEQLFPAKAQRRKEEF
jgi:hypothetical protein